MPKLTENEKAEIILSELEANGVDNWQYYGEAISNFEEEYGEIEDAQDELCALEQGGVDNWSGYDVSKAREYIEYLEDDGTLDWDAYFRIREKEEAAAEEQRQAELAEEAANKKPEYIYTVHTKVQGLLQELNQEDKGQEAMKLIAQDAIKIDKELLDVAVEKAKKISKTFKELKENGRVIFIDEIDNEKLKRYLKENL